MYSLCSISGAAGSPPRVRGTANVQPRGQPHPGITPACAGNRDIRDLVEDVFEDHPRVCGEQVVQALDQLVPKGSPPRVRGTGLSRSFLGNIFGITPACAGNSCRCPFGLSSAWDHPRVCGEQSQTFPASSRKRGSPPRVRGTASASFTAEADNRITPACAGNRSNACHFVSSYRDHPRVCGEQQWPGRRPPDRGGSPPRVRGTALPRDGMDALVGITPACAGNRPYRPGKIHLHRDHPRVCGEQ